MPAENRIHLQDPRDRKRYYFHTTPLRRVLTPTVKAFSRLLATLHCQGVTYLPQQGPVVLAANHVTNYDVFFMQFCLPRPIFFMGKAELFRNPIMDLILRNLSGFPVNRGEKDQWAMQHAARILNYGQVLGMFPEGTRSKGRGLAVAKTGAARLAIDAQCPIVPMAVTGSDQFWKRFPRRTRVQIQLLPALQARLGENPLALTDRLMFTLAQALPAGMRGVYAEMPRGFKLKE